MENFYNNLLDISDNVENPNYYELLGIEEDFINNEILEKAYKNKIQKLQNLGNNSKYKETILFLKAQMRNAKLTLSNKEKRIYYNQYLIKKRINKIEQIRDILNIKGYLLTKEIKYLKEKAFSLKISDSDFKKIIKNNKLKFNTYKIIKFVIIILLFFLTSLYIKNYDYKSISKQKNKEPIQNFPHEVAYVPSGYFKFSNKYLVYLDDYYIKKYEVTNQEYYEFIKDTNYNVPYSTSEKLKNYNWNPLTKKYPKGKGLYPVIFVSWHDANYYCEWASKKYNLKISLPTEAQWEKAAKGNRNIIYPFGNKITKNNANFYTGLNGQSDGFIKLAPVGSFPLGTSPFGCFDMSGNVSEWCLDSYSKYFFEDISLKNPLFTSKNWDFKVAKGGSWEDTENFVRINSRFSFKSDLKISKCGFRYVINCKT